MSQSLFSEYSLTIETVTMGHGRCKFETRFQRVKRSWSTVNWIGVGGGCLMIVGEDERAI